MHEQRPVNEIHRFQREVIGKRYEGASLSGCSFGGGGHDAQKVLDWMKNGKNFLVVMGPPGVGKTYFCSALIEWVCKKYANFRYWHEREFFTRLRGVIRDNSGEWSKEVEYILDDEFVMYDDLGCCGFNEWRKETILAMVDIRYESTKPTVITTNLNKKSIYDNLGERTYSRIFDKSNLLIDMSDMPDRRQSGNP